ncbi:MAG: ATP-dependent RecD-like DNA helicase [Anaerolineae bacterium]
MFNRETLIGAVERVTFYNPDNGYSVIKVKPEGKFPKQVARDGTLTIVGTMPEVNPGQRFEFVGQWEESKYGTQLRVEQLTLVMPTTEDGLVAFLASGIAPGVGKRTAQRVVDYFGEDTARILDNDPDRVYEVPKLMRSQAESLIKGWQTNGTIRRTMIFLQGYGVTSKMATRIIEHYGAATVNKVQQDPYQLADEVFGIGFIRADEIARAMGLDPDDPRRIRAGLHYALSQMTKEGHTYYPRGELVTRTNELLRIDHSARIEAVLSQQLFAGDLMNDESAGSAISKDAVYLPDYYHAEINAAEQLRLLSTTRSELVKAASDLQWGRFFERLAYGQPVDLTEQQTEAVKAALLHKLSVLTGGPGTGKTTTVNMVIRALEALKVKYALASPTGRAAKRLTETTERPASTLHRLLGFGPDGFEHDDNNPLEVDFLIVDETSMVDLMLLENMLNALKPTTHLLLVGDVDQLPSVGAGNVLRDIIDSGLAHVTRLDAIFRQKESSYIVVNAHRINHGEAPFIDNRSDDFYFFGAEDPQEAGSLVVDIVRNRLPARFGIDPLRDVQVIAPMYRGPAGVHALNEALQKSLNGDSSQAQQELGGRKFRVGDKVMQTRNNYEKEVFNGDIGTITGIDFQERALEVVIDDQYLYYEFSEAEELIHAYCISTHRSQGSEYPVVVMPVLTQHYMMLQRNLLYTAITRARQIVVLVGSRKAVHIAVQNNKVATRYSGLLPRLKA